MLPLLIESEAGGGRGGIKRRRQAPPVGGIGRSSQQHFLGLPVFIGLDLTYLEEIIVRHLALYPIKGKKIAVFFEIKGSTIIRLHFLMLIETGWNSRL